eukprot:1129400-Pelagomonas_calceolata.AAC.1
MVWRVTNCALMGLQRSACCRCAASNCCPSLVSSQYFISIKCTSALRAVPQASAWSAVASS